VSVCEEYEGSCFVLWFVWQDKFELYLFLWQEFGVEIVVEQ